MISDDKKNAVTITHACANFQACLISSVVSVHCLKSGQFSLDFYNYMSKVILDNIYLKNTK